MNSHADKPRKQLALRWPLLLLVCLTLSACAVAQIHHRQLASLDKGLGMAQAVTILGQQPAAVYQTSVDNVAYTFQRYSLNNGLNSDLYLLCYQGEQLVYWGYIDEFRRHPDTRINRALADILPALPLSSR